MKLPTITKRAHSRKINQSLLLPVLSYEHAHLRSVLTPFGSIKPAKTDVPIEKLAHLNCSVWLVHVSAVFRSIFPAPAWTNSLAVPMTALTQNKIEIMNGSILSKLFLTQTFIQMFIPKRFGWGVFVSRSTLIQKLPDSSQSGNNLSLLL